METNNNTNRIALAILVLVSKGLVVLGMPFIDIANMVDADTLTVGEAYDGLVASGQITSEMITNGQAIYDECERQADAIRLGSIQGEYDAAEKCANVPAYATVYIKKFSTQENVALNYLMRRANLV